MRNIAQGAIPAASRKQGADIVYSPDDGGWYASMFSWLDGDTSTIKVGGLSRTYSSKALAESWARKRGATMLLYP